MTEPAADDPTATARVERPRRVALFAAVAVVALALDVISKIVVVSNQRPEDPPVRILGGVLYLQQARNSGAAFSLGTGFTAILTVVALVVVVVLIRTAKRLRSAGWA